MTGVTTRAKATRLREDEFSALRNIDLDYQPNCDEVLIEMTRSETGKGKHKRWVYPTDSDGTVSEPRVAIPDLPLADSQDTEMKEENFVEEREENSMVLSEEEEKEKELQQLLAVTLADPSLREFYEPSTPTKSRTTPIPIPSTPKLPSRSFNLTGIRADMDTKLLIEIRKGDDIEEVLRTHLCLFCEARESDRSGNASRVLQLVKNRPLVLGIRREDMESYARENCKDPFV